MNLQGSAHYGSQEVQVVAKDYYFESFDGRNIYAKEKYALERPMSKKVIVCFSPCIYTHHFFDCPLSDYSVMEYLARKGFRVFAYDPRGFGLSYLPPDGRSITYEVELKDAESLVNFVLAQTGAQSVSTVAFGTGAQIACGHALHHSGQVNDMVLMDFFWKGLPEPPPSDLKERLLSQPNGYIQLSLVNDFFDRLLRFTSSEILEWVHSVFTRAPIGPLLMAFETMPLIKPAIQIKASVLIIRGTQAEVTSEQDSFNFLGNIGGQMRAIDVLEGAGPVPSLEERHYRRVLEDMAWFLTR